MKNKKIKAFTLIEIVLIISLVSILLAVVFPSGKILREKRANVEYNTFISDLKACRLMSMAKGKRVGIALSEGGDSYEIVESMNGEYKTLEKVQFKGSLKYSNVNIGSGKIIFTAMGRPVSGGDKNTNSSGTLIFYKDGKAFKRVSVEPILGRVNTYDEK